MTLLSIGHYTALDISPDEYISVAAEAGCQAVSLLVQAPNPQLHLPLVSNENIDQVKEELNATGLAVLNVECFMLTPNANVECFRPALEIGARLNARGATALVYDADEARVIKNLSQLCAMGQQLGLRINLEFMAMTPRWNTVEQAAELIRKIKQPNLGLAIDLLHLIRTGGSVASLANIPDEIIYYAQICDSVDLSASKDYGEEAGGNRLAPGEGRFPIQAFLKSLPQATPLEIEVPQPPGKPAQKRIKSIVAATRRQFQLAGLKV